MSSDDEDPLYSGVKLFGYYQCSQWICHHNHAGKLAMPLKLFISEVVNAAEYDRNLWEKLILVVPHEIIGSIVGNYNQVWFYFALLVL
jgi:hypothetical protein